MRLPRVIWWGFQGARFDRWRDPYNGWRMLRLGPWLFWWPVR